MDQQRDTKPASLNRHEMIDGRLLAMHQLIAEKLKTEPLLLEKVKGNVLKELRRCPDNTKPYFVRWQAILNESLDATVEALTSESEQATALRQSSPFHGILTPEERLDIIRKFRWGQRA